MSGSPNSFSSWGGYSFNGWDRIKFEDLDKVKGQTTIHSHGGSFRCSSLNSLRDGDDDDDDDNNTRRRRDNNNNNNNGAFQGAYTCTDSSSSGLSAGAKAGIAIAVIVLVLLILVGVWMMYRKQRKRRRRRNDDQSQMMYTPVGVGLRGGGGSSNRDEESSAGDEKPVTGVPNPAVLRQNSDSVNALSAIPRKPISPPPPSNEMNRESMVSMSTSPPLPAALVPGDRSSASPPNEADGRSLFLHPIPRRRPSETDVPLLDSADVHEAPGSPVQRPTFELDAGPVRGMHQQPIHHE